MEGREPTEDEEVELGMPARAKFFLQKSTKHLTVARRTLKCRRYNERFQREILKAVTAQVKNEE